MQKPKGHNIFLLDALGALSSIAFLFLLYAFDEFFGMPKSVIKIFICIAAVFFVYSSITYMVKPANWRFYLRIIAVLNICYCLFTAYHMLQNSSKLTLYGYLYFVGEVLIILLLAIYELYHAVRRFAA
jgi:hypothetical protein